MVSAQTRREAVCMAHAMGLSARKACALLGISRSVLRHVLRMPSKDTPFLEAMRRFAAGNRRRGCRPARVRLIAEGFRLGKEKALRLWRQADLLVPRKRTRKRIARNAPSVQVASGLNQIWAYDFVHDMCANGQQLKCLTVIDEYSREALAIEVSGSIRSERVMEVLSRLFSERGMPQFLRSDNGPEFVAHTLRNWMASQGIRQMLTEPGKPWQNGYNESFNGKFRFEPLRCGACGLRGTRKNKEVGASRCLQPRHACRAVAGKRRAAPPQNTSTRSPFQFLTGSKKPGTSLQYGTNASRQNVPRQNAYADTP